MLYKENKQAADALLKGLTIEVIGFGQSMVPKLLSGQKALVAPINSYELLKKGDIVFCKVNGNYYLHLLTAIKNNRFQISNNHKHVNGWIGKNNLYGVVIEKL